MSSAINGGDFVARSEGFELLQTNPAKFDINVGEVKFMSVQQCACVSRLMTFTAEKADGGRRVAGD
jgi:hypothetical protein